MTNSSNYRGWHIVGQGAIGLLCAVQGHYAGVPVFLWRKAASSISSSEDAALTYATKMDATMTDATKASAPAAVTRQHSRPCYIEQTPLQIDFTPHKPLPSQLAMPQKAVSADESLRPEQPHLHVELPASQGELSHVLIPVKAYDVVAVVKALQPYLSEDAQLVLCHNGMGTIAPVQAELGPQQGLWFATTTHGAYKPTPQRVVHSGLGSSLLGPCNNAATLEPQALHQLQAMLAPCLCSHDIISAQWQKLVVNAVINPLTALHQCQNGQLADPRFSHQIESLVAECCAIAMADGIDMPVHAALARVQQVIHATAHNYSSMLQDIRHGRRTELSAITGFLLQKAKQHHIPAIRHAELWQQLSLKYPQQCC